MKLIVKTLDQKSYQLELDDQKTVFDLKKYLHYVERLNILPDRQQLIYGGCVLNNDDILKKHCIDERKFLVVMKKRSHIYNSPPRVHKKKSQTRNEKANNKDESIKENKEKDLLRKKVLKEKNDEDRVMSRNDEKYDKERNNQRGVNELTENDRKREKNKEKGRYVESETEKELKEERAVKISTENNVKKKECEETKYEKKEKRHSAEKKIEMHLSRYKKEKKKNIQGKSKMSGILPYMPSVRHRPNTFLITFKRQPPHVKRLTKAKTAKIKSRSSLPANTRTSSNTEAVKREKQSLPTTFSEPTTSTKKPSKPSTAKTSPRIYDNSEKCKKDEQWMHELAQTYAADVFAAEVATDAREANFGLHHGLNQPPMAGCCQKFLRQIVSMGYDEEEVQRALIASLNNPDRAISYLIEGIPSVINNIPSHNPQTSSHFYNPLAFLRDLPSFRHMRYLIQERPDLLDKVLSKIGNINPELLDMIKDNKDEFLQLINDRSHDMSHLKVNCEDYEDHRTTLNDHRAIERLVRLGFTPVIALQTYMACGRNEALATECLCNYLNN